MKSIISIFTFLALCLVVISPAVSAKSLFTGRLTDYCYSEDPVRPQNLRMNTKTAYQFVKGGQSANIPSGCTPSKFWLLSRHGTRLPSSSKIDKLSTLGTYQAEILNNYANGKQPLVGGLCDADLDLLANWRWDTNISSTMDEYLTDQGWNDLKGIGQHYKTQFPNLLNEYSSDKFLFRHTNTQRTQASYRGFVDGLWGDGAHNNIPAPVMPAQDSLLRPYDYCDLFTEQKKALDDFNSEVSKFEASELYLQVFLDVAAKAGYAPGEIDSSRIEWMFDMCIYELAWKVTMDSPWCSLFKLEQIKIFEYAKDIEEWLLAGKANQLNPRLSCELIQDMLIRLENLDAPQASAYFSHSTALQLFLTGLRYAFQDIPLRADNYEANANRNFRTSRISPLATNVAAVRYECPTGVKIQFFLNERPLELNFCDDGLCDWQDVKAKFATMSAVDCSSYFCST